MEDPKPQAKPPGRVSRFFSWIGSLPKRLFRLGLPAKAALTTAVVLVALVTTAWILFLIDPANVPWRHSMTVGRIVTVLCLTVIIPLVVYNGLKLWLEGESSRFPDIDFAWKAGVTALARNGIELDSAPIFLVLGSPDDRQARAVMDASGLSLRVRDVPSGPAPLHWYANPDAIYLHATDASWVAALAARHEKRTLEAVTMGLDGPEAAAVHSTLPVELESGSLAPAAAEPAPPPIPAAPPKGRMTDSVRGTMMLDQFVSSEAAAGRAPPGATVAAHSAAPVTTPARAGAAESTRGTMMLQSPLAAAATPAPVQPAAPSAVAMPRQASLAPQDSAEQLQRLEHVCQLIRRARQPLCAINGILVELPFDLIQAAPHDVEELEQATRGDLATVQRTLRLRCPVTALVTGMEKESGFRELVRRVGRDRAAVQRFGRGNDLRSLAGVEELAALAVHVCGAFEDWVYTLFREKDALSRPGNTRLYHLLCKVRSVLKGRLTEVLVAGFAHDPALSRHEEPLLFSGCYFAATGTTEDRQAFVRGVFDKLVEEQDQVEWTQRAWRADRRFFLAAMAGLAIDAVLVLGLGAMLLWRMVGK
jgi:hypothetical protein